MKYINTREKQQIQARQGEGIVKSYLEKQSNVLEVRELKDFGYSTNRMKSIDDYIDNELNKLGVDMIVHLIGDRFAKVDIKTLTYNKSLYGRLDTQGKVSRLYIQIENYNGLEGWGISEHKVTDKLMLYIKGSGLYSLDYRKFRSRVKQIIEKDKVNREKYNNNDYEGVSIDYWVECENEIVEYYENDKGSGKVERCISVPINLIDIDVFIPEYQLLGIEGWNLDKIDRSN